MATLLSTTVNGTLLATTSITSSGAVYASNWFRSYGANGWYNETYGGGWYMNDTSYLKPYNGKSINMGNASIDYNAQIHFNGGTRFVNNDDHYLIFKTDATNYGGIYLKDGNGTTRSYLAYYDSNGAGHLNSSGQWAVRYNGSAETSLFNNGNEKVRTLSVGARVYGNLYLDDNYGNTIVGVYTSTRYQGIFAMGDSYKLPADGTSTGSLYGLAWSHPNAGGVAGNLNTHGLLVMENGTFLAAISGSIRARDDVRAPALYDSGSRVAISRGEGRNYVDYSRYVYNNNAYSGSGWVEPSDLGVRYANSAGSASSAGSATYADRLQTGNNQWTWSNGAHSATNPNTITLWDQYSNYGGSGNPTSYGTVMDIYGRSGHEHDQLYFGESGQFLHRNCFYGTNSWSGWRTILNSSNYNSYSPTLTGGGASGTWSISITGRADGALKFWSTSHPNDYYIVNNWTGSHWYLTSNHGSPVRVGYADSAGSASSASSATYITIPDWRDTTYSPNQYNGNSVVFHFNNVGQNSGPAGDYWGAMMTVSPWSQYNDSHRQSQIWFGGSSGLSYRYAVGSGYTPTGWSGWERIVTSANIGSFGLPYGNWGGSTGMNDQKLYFRTNGDNNHYLWNAGDDWEELVFYSGTGFRISGSNGGNYANFTTGAATFNTQVYVNRHIDANTTWGNCGCTSVFLGWSGGKVILGNNANGGHDYANNLGSNTVVSTNNFYCYLDITAYSDKRVKENVEVIEDAVEKVKAIRGVTFTRNDVEDKEKRHAGVIAQEVLEVLPEVVSEDTQGHYSVAYGNLTSLLIEAIKEQQKQIEVLTQKITELENK